MDHTPSGKLDGGSLCAESYNRSHYSLCDMSDEEVHFSRDSIGTSSSQANKHYYQPNQYYHLANDSPLQSGNFNDISLPSYHNQQGGISTTANAERAQSNKLLHSIGSKLKRGSNFLAAPKLVGQYLLGITIQSWSEFLNTSKLMRAPCNRHQWTRRLLTNLSHFQGNYLCVSLVLVIYCILTSPLLLLAIVAYLTALYLVTARSATGRHLVLAGGFRPNLRQQYSFITLISLPLLWVAGAPSAVFWVIGATFVVVGLHASMYSVELLGASELTDQHGGPAQQVVATVAQRGKWQPRNSTPAESLIHTARYTTNHYLPLAGNSVPSCGIAGDKTQAERKSSVGYSSSITQWILSGGKQKASNQLQEMRVPEVTIISQDYAGLGRIYDV